MVSTALVRSKTGRGVLWEIVRSNVAHATMMSLLLCSCFDGRYYENMTVSWKECCCLLLMFRPSVDVLYLTQICLFKSVQIHFMHSG